MRMRGGLKKFSESSNSRFNIEESGCNARRQGAKKKYGVGGTLDDDEGVIRPRLWTGSNVEILRFCRVRRGVSSESELTGSK